MGRILESRFIPIRTRFMVCMIATILLFGAINLYISHTFVLKAAHEQAEDGVGDASATDHGRKVSLALSAMILVFLFLGMGGALVFANFISDPINKIIRGFDAFAPGGPMPRIQTPFNDELRQLSPGFPSLMERINEADRNFKEAQAKILETERLASMGTLATGLAHEINNPIAGIQMCVRRLQKSS